MEESYEVAIYNAEKKELIGIFKDIKTCSNYIFEGKGISYTKKKLHENLRNKFAITGSRFDFRLVVRLAKTEHRELLGDKVAVINRAYPRYISKYSSVI